MYETKIYNQLGVLENLFIFKHEVNSLLNKHGKNRTHVCKHTNTPKDLLYLKIDDWLRSWVAAKKKKNIIIIIKRRKSKTMIMQGQAQKGKRNQNSGKIK